MTDVKDCFQLAIRHLVSDSPLAWAPLSTPKSLGLLALCRAVE